jgi:membrane protein YqaA with SNARE-associated domain
MNKKKTVKFSLTILNFLVIFLLIWSLVNYTFLSNEVSQFIQVGGLLAMIFFVILLEGAPVFAGPGLGVASILAMGVFNPWFILLLFLVSAFIGNIFYFYLGYFSGKKILKYFDKKDIEKYEKLFKKYGFWAMVIMAISPIPYLPTLAGVFRMTSPILIAEILIIRMIRHVIVFLFWFYFLVGF